MNKKITELINFFAIPLIVFFTILGVLTLLYFFGPSTVNLKLPLLNKVSSTKQTKKNTKAVDPRKEMNRVSGKTSFRTEDTEIKTDSEKSTEIEQEEKTEQEIEIQRPQGFENLTDYTYGAIKYSDLDKTLVESANIKQMADEARWQLAVEWDNMQDIVTIEAQHVSTDSAVVFPSNSDKLYIGINGKLYKTETHFTGDIIILGEKTLEAINSK